MFHVMGLCPFQLSAERIVDTLRKNNLFSTDQLAVVFPHNISPFPLGFRPRTLPSGEVILEVVRFDTPSRYSGIIISARVNDESQALAVEKILDEGGVLWRGRGEVVPAYIPSFIPPEWMSRELGGMLREDYRV